ncbi:protoporphyrinogen/coproporphyrinogen oxidase [Chlorobium phaeobacteroides]|jgi:oxygen-dependent protoporphyrinogen oxidase|uniref:Amine oxidase n=1 Tax=Chlorobium phaeobacteroides (strain DSM 266 / SMG 266 / 2430) TaxID=290317 RepID=A1BHE2_CHLPD|nr:FAD-dependent oxidoreductase [Chlorobium phaeobacteroides]ABL65819.1 amine oxidase [Chlorobium phaeobacteroides DSM 266]
MMRAAVIGGGISGIASAYYLMQHNISVDLYESADRIGGRIGSERLGERWLDFGGKNIGKNYRLFRDFVLDCGVSDFEYFGFNTSQVIGGRVVSINKEGARLFNAIRFFGLCGFSGLRKLYPHVRAILNDRRQGVLASEYFSALAEEYDHLSLAGYLKEPCLSHIVRPVTVRMNGAEPDECYPGNFGSNLALLLDSYEQLQQGMHGMLEAFQLPARSALLRILPAHRVTSVNRDHGKGAVMIGYEYEGRSLSAEYDRVVSALPALRLSELLETFCPEVSVLLRRIQYFPVAVAIVKYRQNVFPKEQRAMVFDDSFPLSNAGAYGINDLDLVRYTFSGRAARAMVSDRSQPEAVITLGEEIAGRYFTIKDNTRESFVFRYLSEGLCAYSPYHHRLLAEVDQKLDFFSGFAATGDYRRGASIEACFRAAGECVHKLLDGGKD